MNLLISNDDGIFSAGLRALADELHRYYNVVVVAPEGQQSGTSHACTYVQPVRVREVTLPGLENVPAYAVDGTPADCTRLGCTSLGLHVDMVISGINHGANLGSDVFYSGTVGAAMEAALTGTPAIAVSCAAFNPVDFTAAARAALWTVDYVRRNPLPENMILNLNAPELPIAEIKGLRLTGLCLQQYENTHACFDAPNGSKYFLAPFGKLTKVSENDDHDERWIREGYVTLTPIHYDIACYSYMRHMDVADFNLTGLTIDRALPNHPGDIDGTK